ncbi:MAG TPA: CHASE3 domain-containing protein [Candidatus Angelobacter sp.]|nr:CHASE3 domain-containing protein [Candidatus Angelobacter sp.]
MDERSFQRLLRRTVVIPVALLVLLAGVLVIEILSLSSALRTVDHTEQILTDARALMRYMLDMEGAIRGFYLTGDRSFLEPYVSAKPGVILQMNLLRKLAADEPDQLGRLDEIKALDEQWIAHADRLLAEDTPSHSVADYTAGKQIMDQIRAKTSELLDRAQALRTMRYERARMLNSIVMATAVGLSLLIAVLLLTLTRRELRRLSDTYEKHLLVEGEKSRLLAESRERFQITLNSLGDAVVATDADGGIRYINPVAQALTGWADYLEARGRPLREVAQLLDERTRAELPDPVEAVRRSEKVVRLSDPMLLISRTGQEYPIEMNGAPILNDDGQLIGVVLVFRDITQRRQTEQTLQASDRLTQAGRMAATIAHEIRNPLDTVSNLLFLLRHDSYPKPETKQYLELASEELIRITHITGQLLTFHREAQSPVQVDLVKVLESVLTLYSPQIQMVGINVTRRFETHRAVRGFPGELRQVFANLVANAVHSMPGGGRLLLHVYESSLRSDAQRKGVRVTVLDTGSGIAPDVRKNLFAPFYTTKGESGTGLGLWVTRGIIEKHEGSVSFISSVRPGCPGTAFSVFLPFDQATGKLDLPKTAHA